MPSFVLRDVGAALAPAAGVGGGRVTSARSCRTSRAPVWPPSRRLDAIPFVSVVRARGDGHRQPLSGGLVLDSGTHRPPKDTDLPKSGLARCGSEHPLHCTRAAVNENIDVPASGVNAGTHGPVAVVTVDAERA